MSAANPTTQGKSGSRAYTDGSARPNPGPGGAGVVYTYGGCVTRELVYAHKGATTNNQMELIAVILALTHGTPDQIITDSNYVVKGINEWSVGWIKRGWITAGGKPVLNMELWKTLLNLLSERKTEIYWTAAHVNNPLNDLADTLANRGTDSAISGIYGILPTVIPDMNTLIIGNLEVMYKEARAGKESKDAFRAKAYAEAIKAIKALETPILSGADAVKRIHVGAKIAAKIDEIIATGKLHQVTALGGDYELQRSAVIKLFTGVWGIGPVKAQALYDLGARSISDLEDHIKSLTTNQKIGLKYYADFQVRVQRDEVTAIALRIKDVIIELNNSIRPIRSKVCGSYRRGMPTCGDMDILIYSEEPNALNTIVCALRAAGIVKETLGLGETKFLGVVHTSEGRGFRLDIESVSAGEWPFALIYFTGSGSFNEYQRSIAKKAGYTLSEHGLKNLKTGDYVKGLQTEESVFEFLKMDYLEPLFRKK